MKNICLYRLFSRMVLFCTAAGLGLAGCQQPVSQILKQTGENGTVAEIADLEKVTDQPQFGEGITILPGRLELEAEFDDCGQIVRLVTDPEEDQNPAMGVIKMFTRENNGYIERSVYRIGNETGESNGSSIGSFYQVIELKDTCSDNSDWWTAYQGNFIAGLGLIETSQQIIDQQEQNQVIVITRRLDQVLSGDRIYSESICIGEPFDGATKFEMYREVTRDPESDREDLKSYRFTDETGGIKRSFHAGFDQVGVQEEDVQNEVYSETEFCTALQDALNQYTDVITVEPLTYETRETQIAVAPSVMDRTAGVKITALPDENRVIVERTDEVNTQAQDVEGSSNEAYVATPDEDGKYPWQKESSEEEPEFTSLAGYWVDDTNQIIYQFNEPETGLGTNHKYEYGKEIIKLHDLVLKRKADGTRSLSTVANKIQLGTVVALPDGDLTLDGQVLRAVPSWVCEGLQGSWISGSHSLSFDSSGK